MAWNSQTSVSQTSATTRQLETEHRKGPRPPLWRTIASKCVTIKGKQSVGTAATQNCVVKFDGEICGRVLVENASDDFPSKRSSTISFQTSPEVCHQFCRKLRQLHSGNHWCLNLYRAKRRGGFGVLTAADPFWQPGTIPEKQTVGTVPASHKMFTPQALLSTPCRHCKERLPGPRKRFGATSGSQSPKTAASICSV